MDSPKPPVRRPSARQAREQLRQLTAMIEAQAAIGWALILVIVALLGVIYLNQTSHIATVGSQVQRLQFNLTEIKRQNNELERHIAQAQTFVYLQDEANRLGFSQAQPTDIEYIIIPNYPGTVDESQLTSSIVAETAVLPSYPDTIGEALYVAIKSQINSLMQGEASE